MTPDEHLFVQACDALSSEDLSKAYDGRLRVVGPAWIRFLRRWRYERDPTPAYRVTDGRQSWYPDHLYDEGIHFPRKRWR